MWGDELQNRCVITGFRTIEEVAFIREKVPGCQVVLIEASERTRLERHLKRARLGSLKTIDDFRRDDRQQASFGLLEVARDLVDMSIENEGSIEEFHSQIEAIVGRRTEGVGGISRRACDVPTIMAGRLFRCLCALEKAGGPQSCPEIGEATVMDDSPAGGRREPVSHVERPVQRFFDGPMIPHGSGELLAVATQAAHVVARVGFFHAVLFIDANGGADRFEPVVATRSAPRLGR
jgi:hypothetical protein